MAAVLASAKATTAKKTDPFVLIVRISFFRLEGWIRRQLILFRSLVDRAFVAPLRDRAVQAYTEAHWEGCS